MTGRQIVVALIRLAGVQTLWSAFWNLTYVAEEKARYLIEVNSLPRSAPMTLNSIRMITFRCELSLMFGLALLLFAPPLAGLLMKPEKTQPSGPSD